MTKLGLGLVAAAAVAAGQTTATPGQMTQARVWIQNRGRGEAVPVDLRESNLDAPLRVRIVNADASDSAVAPVLVRPARPVWEYQTITVAGDQDAAAILNRQGAAGWETTGITFATAGGTMLLLKRLR